MHTQPSSADLADAAPSSAPGRWHTSWFGNRAAALREPLGFVLAFVFLNAVMNQRYPAHQPTLWYLVPSLDVVALFVVFALCGVFHARTPRAVHGVLVGLFLLARALRVADGIEMGAYYRNFNTVVDFPLLPEFVRLFYVTVPLARFVLSCLLILAVLGLLGFLIHRALRVAQAALASPRYALVFSSVVGVLALASPFEWQAPREKGSPFAIEDDRRLSGAFGSSIVARVASELDFAANIYGYKVDKVAGIARLQERLAHMPLDLKKLAGQNVYLFVIESYGQCVLDRPLLSARVLPEYQRFDQDLSRNGFQIASRVLDSSTYGGRSWLAHATLSTGVRTVDQFQLELLRAAQPKTLAQAFGDAGYRTVVVQPATSYESPLKDIHHFQNHYYQKDLGYAGPKFGWSPMPDEFVMDFVRRRELIDAKRPLFLEYALTSSHGPWSDLPPVIDDWSTVANGAIYNRESGTHFANGWLELGGASEAYAESVVYDLEVLRRYVTEFVRDDSLVIVVGDHQPHSEVTEQNPATGVPIHVLSRNSSFIDAFRARGYTPGMRASAAGPHPGLETFMTDLLSDFSVGPVKQGKN